MDNAEALQTLFLYDIEFPFAAESEGFRFEVDDWETLVVWLRFINDSGNPKQRYLDHKDIRFSTRTLLEDITEMYLRVYDKLDDIERSIIKLDM